MQQKHEQIASSILGALGLTVSVQDLNQIINLILLILSVINILIVLGNKVYNHVKNKKYDEVPQDINEAIDDIEKLKKKDGE